MPDSVQGLREAVSQLLAGAGVTAAGITVTLALVICEARPQRSPVGLHNIMSPTLRVPNGGEEKVFLGLKPERRLKGVPSHVW